MVSKGVKGKWKTMEKYKITISDPWELGGQSFLAKQLGIVKPPNEPNWGTGYLLLEVIQPFLFKNEIINFIIVTTRYEGVPIESIHEKECSIGISRLLPQYSLSVGSRFSKEMVEYFAIGSITKINSFN